jgi:glucosamine-6-phosphate deaminase
MAENISVNGASVTIAEDYGEMCRLVAEVITSRLLKNPQLNLLLPTGVTPAGVYKILSEKPKLLAKASLFNLDEYCFRTKNGVVMMPEDDPRSYKLYMKENLLTAAGARSHFPNADNAERPGSYDGFIGRAGGIGLCLNSIGEDGHTFGFNMPGASFGSVTRLVKLSGDTRKVNKKLTGMDTPEYAITTGIATGMASKEIVVISSGKRKAKIVRDAIAGPLTDKVPASVLRNHPNCIWIIDRDSAGRL